MCSDTTVLFFVCEFQELQITQPPTPPLPSPTPWLHSRQTGSLFSHRSRKMCDRLKELEKSCVRFHFLLLIINKQITQPISAIYTRFIMIIRHEFFADAKECLKILHIEVKQNNLGFITKLIGMYVQMSDL